MIGDVRKYGKVIPLGFRMMECFLQAGFMNKEIIIKEQHNCCSTEYWETKIIIFTSGTRVHICFSEVRQFTKSESFGCYFVCLQV